MIAVDASVWVSSLSETDAFHLTSLAFVDRWTPKRSISNPSLFLAEVAGAFRRTDVTENDLALGVSAIVSAPAEIATKCRLRGADAVYVALADQLSLPLVTWDKEQLERGGEVVHTLTPEQELKQLM